VLRHLVRRPGAGRKRLLVTLTVTIGFASSAAPPTAASLPRPADRPNCRDVIPQELTPPTVDVELELSSTTVVEGEPLRLKVTVRNNGPIPVPYTRGGLTHDFWIRDERGVVWVWSQGKGYTDHFQRDYLWPGETRTGRTRWGSQCGPDHMTLRPGLPGPGRYVARALWVSDVDDEDGDGHGSWWSNEVPFRIRPNKRG
jgi:hypothetical protein